MTSCYQSLEKLFNRLANYQHLGALAAWDQQTMMPAGGQNARAAALAEVDVLYHETLTTPAVGEWIEQAADETLDAEQHANLREMRRAYQQAAVLPARLVEDLSLAATRCEFAWRQQRPNNDWPGFADNLRPLVALAREEAAVRADATGRSRYDALLDKFEPGITSADLDRIFGGLRDWLPDLLQRVLEHQSGRRPYKPEGPFAIVDQKHLARAVMDTLGFDFNRGRLDVSTHPFSGGSPDDTRLTTRYREDECITALMGTIHETGHARYEQNLPARWRGQPVGRARSMAVHESQSLSFEMQLARSRLFIERLVPMLVDYLGERPGFEPDNVVALVQQVEAGLIRVDADEVSYPLHIMLRYEIERALIEGDIEVDDIPALWNERMQAYLGRDTRDNFTDGCMQDTHWAAGLFGYFPTYSLGAMLAAQLYAAAERDVPDLEFRLAAGDYAAWFDFLDTRIWQQASRQETPDLVKQATGEALNPDCLRRHLERRYLG